MSQDENRSLPELDRLFQDIGYYKDSTNYKELFEFVKKFPNIAPYNAMLLHIQKPGSRYVLSATDWEKRFRRYIKPNARPLVILRPFGPVAFVFELGDTYGDDKLISDEILHPFQVKGKLPPNIFDRLIENLKTDGILYSEADHGTSSAGFIKKEKSHFQSSIFRGKKKIFVHILFNLVVNQHHSLEEKFATVIHELAHIYCGHLGTPNSKWWNDRSKLGLNEEEFEAESVCWLVCERLGIKNPSEKYLSGYLDNNRHIPKISIDTVLKAVAIIESMFRNTKPIRKEIILRIEDEKKDLFNYTD